MINFSWIFHLLYSINAKIVSFHNNALCLHSVKKLAAFIIKVITLPFAWGLVDFVIVPYSFCLKKRAVSKIIWRTRQPYLIHIYVLLIFDLSYVILYCRILSHIHPFILSKTLDTYPFHRNAQLPYIEGMQYKESRNIPTSLYIILLIISTSIYVCISIKATSVFNIKLLISSWNSFVLKYI